MTESRSASGAAPLAPADERLWSILAHVGNVVGFLPALLILLILGPRSERVRRESTEALNFVITALIVWVGLFIVGRIADAMDVLILSPLVVLLVGFLQFAVWVLVIVFSIVAAVRVSGGGTFRYPISLRLIK